MSGIATLLLLTQPGVEAPRAGSITTTASGVELSSPVPVARTVNVTLPTTGSIVSAWNAAIATAVSGDRLLIPAGNYTADGNLDINGKSGITVEFASGAVVTYTNTELHSLRIHNSSHIFIKGAPATSPFVEPSVKFLTTGVVGRGSNDLGGHAGISIYNSNIVFLQDVQTRGAKAAGVFTYRSTNVKINRCWSRDSLADAYHITDTSSLIDLWDSTSQNSGDDGVGIVHYSPRQPPEQASHTINVTRHRVLGTTHGRGLAVVNCHDVAIKQLFVRDSAAAGYLVVNEYYNEAVTPGPSSETFNVTADDVYLFGCNYGPQDHGSFAYVNSDATINLSRNLSLTNLITESPGSGSWNQVKGLTGRITAITMSNWRHFGTGATQVNMPSGTINGATSYSPTVTAGASPTSGRAQWQPADATPPATGTRQMPTGLLRFFNGETLAGLANGAAITSWADTGSLGGTLTRDAATAPTKRVGLNNRPAANFNGSQEMRMAGPTSAAQPLTLVAVVTPTSTTGVRQLLHGGDGAEIVTDGSSWAAWAGSYVTSPTGSVTANEPTVITYVYNGTTSAIYKNGTQIVSGNFGTGGLNASTLAVGNHIDQARSFFGDLYELRVYNHVLDATERQAVHSEAQDRYGVTVSDYLATTPDTTPPAGGGGAATWTFTGVGAGSRPAGGSGTEGWTFTGVGMGSRPAGGGGTGTWNFNGSGIGLRAASGSGSGSLTFNSSGAGLAPVVPPPAGGGMGSVSFASGGEGSRVSSGAGSGTVTYDGMGSGTRPSSGSGASSTTYTGTGSGARPSSGGGMSALSYEDTGSGTRPASGGGTGTATYTSIGRGTRAAAGSGVGTTSYSSIGFGDAPPVPGSGGEGTGSWSFASTGSGSRPAGGGGTGSWSFSGAGRGVRASRGTGTGSLGFTSSGSGSSAPGGGGTGIVTRTSSGAGARPSRGGGTGEVVYTSAGRGPAPVPGQNEQVIIPVFGAFDDVGTGAATFVDVGTGSGAFDRNGQGTAMFDSSPVWTGILEQDGVGTGSLDHDGVGKAEFASDGVGVGSFA